MGLLKLFGEASLERSRGLADSDRKAQVRRDDLAHLLDGRQTLEVVGESNYQEEFWAAVGGRRNERIREEVIAVLSAEDDNPYDPHAVSVWVDSLRVGYLSRENAARYRPGLLALQAEHGAPIALRAVIAGGGMRPDGPRRLGIFLSYEPHDVGVRKARSAPPRGGLMMTGLSDAMATDRDDDAYDLGWLDTLPADGVAAIGHLREGLKHERDPIDRHFMVLRA